MIRADFREVRSKLYAILDASEMESSRTTVVFPRTRETLDYLSSRSVRLGVLTNSGRRAAAEILDRAGLNGCFEFVLCREDVATMKPRPDGLISAIAMLGLPREQIFYIGDSRFDIIAARQAGVKVVAVSTGNYSETRLKEEGADYVIPSISELPGLLGV